MNRKFLPNWRIEIIAVTGCIVVVLSIYAAIFFFFLSWKNPKTGVEKENSKINLPSFVREKDISFSQKEKKLSKSTHEEQIKEKSIFTQNQMAKIRHSINTKKSHNKSNSTTSSRESLKPRRVDLKTAQEYYDFFVKHRQYLFSVSDSTKETLNQGKIPDSILKIIKENKMVIYPSSIVKSVKDKEWMLLDQSGGGDNFIIQHENAQLKIYRFMRKELATYSVENLDIETLKELKQQLLGNSPSDYQTQEKDESYTWIKNPELAFQELFAEGKKWNLALNIISLHYPAKLPELRDRILITLPPKKRGSLWHRSMLLELFYYDRKKLFEEEIALLLEHNMILSKIQEKIERDPNGDFVLQEIGKFSKYSQYALEKLKSKFLWRIPELRKIVDQMPNQNFGSSLHQKIIDCLAKQGEYITHAEKELLLKEGLPSVDLIKKTQGRALKQKQRYDYDQENKKRIKKYIFLHGQKVYIKRIPVPKAGEEITIDGQKYTVYEEKSPHFTTAPVPK